MGTFDSICTGKCFPNKTFVRTHKRFIWVHLRAKYLIQLPVCALLANVSTVFPHFHRLAAKLSDSLVPLGEWKWVCTWGVGSTTVSLCVASWHTLELAKVDPIILEAYRY